MTRVLIFIGHYLPASRVGGPARSTASMVGALPDYKFHIFASETDFRSDAVLEGIEIDRWQQRGGATVFYASAKNRTPMSLRRRIREIKPDFIYLHSFFAIRFTLPILVMRRLRLLPRVPIVLAPRGEFSPGALRLKRGRKAVYLGLARRLGLYNRVIWHAASAQEKNDICQVQGDNARVVLASNFPVIPRADAAEVHEKKATNICKLVFLSRISRKKNLLGAIESLKSVHGNIVFDIYGPIEDPGYWAECCGLSKQLPGNVTIKYRGEVSQGAAQEIFRSYDALFFPTLGENYGYVIPEAWAAATPVIISDRTPWQDLEAKRAGWALPLEDRQGFVRCIENLAGMDETEHARWRSGAYRVSMDLSQDESLQAAYQHLFDTALKSKGNR